MNYKLTLLAAAAALVLAAPACVVHDDDDHYHDDDGHHGYDDDGGGQLQEVYTTIDADHVLDTDLGEGAGLFVEYAVGGRWTIWTSCDTNITGSLCTFEAHITVQKGSITDVLQFDTEDYDSVSYFGDNGMTFYTETGTHTDAVEFYAEPGALVEVDLVLDGYQAPEYLVWYGNGYVHNGASGSPVVFQPDQP